LIQLIYFAKENISENTLHYVTAKMEGAIGYAKNTRK
jgi:hypothetical protein